MQLVIDIDDYIAQGIIDGENDTPRNIVRAFQATIAYAIKKGTPLQKGHGRLIDASNLKNTIHEKSFNSGMMNPIFTYAEIMNMVDVLPTINAIQLYKVKRAREKMESEVFESLDENGNDWFTASKVYECMEILDKLIESEE